MASAPGLDARLAQRTGNPERAIHADVDRLYENPAARAVAGVSVSISRG
jgi:hypothetical protein